MGMKPIVAHKSTDALNVVKLQTVHAALVDVLLPKTSGVDLAQEFRKTKFADNPIVLVSGVFKDKTFAAEAIKKTGAVEFLFKPFSVEELTKALTDALSNVLTLEKWDVPSLLTRNLKTSRERAKAIEHLEEIQGLDFPFVLNLLTENDISGHLNIVNDSGEIFGVTIVKGTVANIDSIESQSAGVLSLIARGFLNQEDWDNYQASAARKISLDKLVEDSFVSPHAVDVARHEQILVDFRTICGSKTLRLNFALVETDEEPPGHAVRIQELLEVVKDAMHDFFTEDYLKEFYGSVAKSAIRSNPEKAHLWKDKSFLGMNVLQDIIQKGGTFEELLKRAGPDRAAILHALHYLVLSQALTFTDSNRQKSQENMVDRYQKVYDELKDREPDKIFEYFGAPPMASAKVVEGIYEEYSKSNSPDKLPSGSPAQLVDLCRKCFNLVKDARDKMLDEKWRQEIVEARKKSSSEKVRQAKDLITQGLEILRKGQFQQALDKLKEAGALHRSSVQLQIQTWAAVKAGAYSSKAQLSDAIKKLESLPKDDRQSVYYYMAMGLLKKRMGDQNAASFFEKALEADPTFIEARRELSAGTEKKETKKLDIFTGDITEVVSNLFKRKAD